MSNVINMPRFDPVTVAVVEFLTMLVEQKHLSQEKVVFLASDPIMMQVLRSVYAQGGIEMISRYHVPEKVTPAIHAVHDQLYKAWLEIIEQNKKDKAD